MVALLTFLHNAWTLILNVSHTNLGFLLQFATGELQQCPDRKDLDGKVEVGKPSLANPEVRFPLLTSA